MALPQPLSEISTMNTSWWVRRVDNLTTFIPTVLKSRSLNLLEPSGLLQACNGIALATCLVNPYHISIISSFKLSHTDAWAQVSQRELGSTFFFSL